MTDNDSGRAIRLAEALRANLRKRKAQARDSKQPGDAPPSADDAGSRSPE